MLWPFDARPRYGADKADVELVALKDAVEQMKNDQLTALRLIENRLDVVEDAVVAIRRVPGSCCERCGNDGQEAS